MENAQAFPWLKEYRIDHDYVNIFVESINGKMLYISTDYVFDGKNPPFHHDLKTNPLNEYGRMKRDGEDVVLKENKGKY